MWNQWQLYRLHTIASGYAISNHPLRAGTFDYAFNRTANTILVTTRQLTDFDTAFLGFTSVLFLAVTG